MNLEHTRICTTLGTIRVKTSHLEDTKLIYWITVTSQKTSFANRPYRKCDLQQNKKRPSTFIHDWPK